ncbi:hypothetical protein, partial [Xanthomonas sacchari]|uniref:hypothetical protein n=1 Tax=Xanthomonas sacchari TaxID=56458 RepID=UPI00225A3068
AGAVIATLAGAGIAGAVIATLAATILSTNTHLSTLELGLHWCHSHHKGLCACLLCVAHVWVHLAPSAASAALAATSATTVSSAARHFQTREKGKDENIKQQT